MLRLKRIRFGIGIALTFFPLVTSWVAICNESVILGIVAVFAMFVVVRFLPCTRGYESIWVFLLSTITSIPFNLKLVCWLMKNSFAEGEFFVLQILRCAMIYVVVFCVEEVILGFITRLIWKRQKVISIN